MNRSILLVICDFLLLSLLALADFEKPEQEQAQTEPETYQAENALSPEEDFIEILKESLEYEKEAKEELTSSLEQTKDALEDRDKALQEREQMLKQTQQTAEELAKAKAQLEAERQRLAEEKAAADQQRQQLSENLVNLREQSAAEQARMKALQEELQARQQQIAQVEENLKGLEGEKRKLETERQQLATRLEVSETEKQYLQERVSTAQTEVALVRAEKEKAQETATTLAEGVRELAGSTTEISREIKNIAETSPNAIYRKFTENKIDLSFTITQDTLLGGSIERGYNARAVLVTDGSRTWALFHNEDTPFESQRAVSRYNSIDGILEARGKRYRIAQVTLLRTDPRLLAIPISEAVLEQTGMEAFPIALDPSKFPEAVIIQDAENYGSTSFKYSGQNNRYLEMRKGIVNSLQGQFNPSVGDLVFGKTGEFIGIMANDDYAVIVQTFLPETSLSIGTNFDPDSAEDALSQRKQRINTLPGQLR